MYNINKFTEDVLRNAEMLKQINTILRQYISVKKFVDVIEEMYEDGKVEFINIWDYIEKCYTEEKKEISKYIKWQKNNVGLCVYDYTINVLDIFNEDSKYFFKKDILL